MSVCDVGQWTKTLSREAHSIRSHWRSRNPRTIFVAHDDRKRWRQRLSNLSKTWERKSEFPGRRTAKPVSHLPILLPLLSSLTSSSFPSLSAVSCFFPLFSFFSLLPPIPFFSFFRPRFFFSPPFPRKLDSCFQFCAERKRGAAHSFVSSTLSFPVETFVSGVCLNFFFHAARPSILLLAHAKLIRLTSSSRPLDRSSACDDTRDRTIAISFI